MKKQNGFLKELRKNKFIYLIALPGMLYFLIFNYLPMFGIVIAFQKYNPVKGFFGSKFVGLKNFEFFFASGQWVTVTFNTLFLNAL